MRYTAALPWAVLGSREPCPQLSLLFGLLSVSQPRGLCVCVKGAESVDAAGATRVYPRVGYTQLGLFWEDIATH